MQSSFNSAFWSGCRNQYHLADPTDRAGWKNTGRTDDCGAGKKAIHMVSAWASEEAAGVKPKGAMSLRFQ